MKNIFFFMILFFFLSNCTGSGSKGLLGTGVSIATDPRSLGTQKFKGKIDFGKQKIFFRYKNRGY